MSSFELEFSIARDSLAFRRISACRDFGLQFSTNCVFFTLGLPPQV
jgi:hypothetical protein